MAPGFHSNTKDLLLGSSSSSSSNSSKSSSSSHHPIRRSRIHSVTRSLSSVSTVLYDSDKEWMELMERRQRFKQRRFRRIEIDSKRPLYPSCHLESWTECDPLHLRTTDIRQKVRIRWYFPDYLLPITSVVRSYEHVRFYSFATTNTNPYEFVVANVEYADTIFDVAVTTFVEIRQNGNDGNDEDDEWEYYDDTPNKTVLFPHLPASLLDRWSTSIWDPSDDDDDDDEDDDDEEEEADDDDDDEEEVVDPDFERRHERLLEWVKTELTNPDFFRTTAESLSSFPSSKLRYTRHDDGNHNIVEYLSDSSLEKRGVYREWKNNEFESMGWIQSSQGRKKGRNPEKNPIWRKLSGNSFLVTSMNDTTTYLYPGLKWAVLGRFETDGRLSGFGQYGRVVDITYNYDDTVIVIPIPIVSKSTTGSSSSSSTFIFYDPSTSIRISQNPLIRDVYERHTVYVSISEISNAGQGLFAKRDLIPGSLVALFNGVRRRDSSTIRSQFSDYSISIRRDLFLDIPSGQETLSKYKATLGHKCCHSFQPNSIFEPVFHPRFGHIMSIVASQFIPAHHEITVSYNYNISYAPRWYSDLWFQYLRTVENVDENTLHGIAKRKSKDSGIPINVPDPPEDSPRFDPCQKCKRHLSIGKWSMSCSDCQTWFHFQCVDGVEEQQLQTAFYANEDILWKCFKCRQL